MLIAAAFVGAALVLPVSTASATPSVSQGAAPAAK